MVPQTNVVYMQGFVVIRASYVPQKFSIQSGTQTLDVIASYLQTQTDSLMFGVSIEEYFNNRNNYFKYRWICNGSNFRSSSRLGEELGFTVGQTNTSSYPLYSL